MEWKLDKNRPLCPQICEQLCVKIALGEYSPNQRLESVRDTALIAGVNPNTVQRSFESLEQQGVLYSVRGSGWFVADNISLSKEILHQLLSKKTAEYFSAMKALGLDSNTIKKYVEEWDK